MEHMPKNKYNIFFMQVYINDENVKALKEKTLIWFSFFLFPL
jgi:hypothetical protein